jgi:hypothetical protein
MAKKPTKLKKSKKAAQIPTPYQSPTVSDDEDVLDYDEIPKAQRLNNCYAEWLDPNNTKGERQLAREHNVGKSSLQGRIKGAKPKAQDAEDRQRLTLLEEEALKDWCLQLEAWGFPARVEALRRMAKDMLLAKGDINPLGKNWQSYFFERHLELKSKFIPPLDKERAGA